MGKASKWFRNFLGLKKPEPPPTSSPRTSSSTKTPHLHKDKRRWSFVKSYREKENSAATKHITASTTVNNSTTTAKSSQYGRQGHQDLDLAASECEVDQSKHAIAVAAATAAVAEAAVAAAQAAAAVVSLTSTSGRCRPGAVSHVWSSCGEEVAAIRIQSTFRGYLARRALRALKGLVRLQALVRGHIERKRTAEWMRRMQALLRAQARACAGRVQVSESSQSNSKTSHFQNPGPPTPEKFEHAVRSRSTKYVQSSSMLKRSWSKSNGRNIGDDYGKMHGVWTRPDSRMEEQSWDNRVPSTRIIRTIDDVKNDKVLEVDTGKHHLAYKCRNLFPSTHLALTTDQYSYSFTHSKDSNKTVTSLSSVDVDQSLSPLKFSHHEVEGSCFSTAENSPQFYSASSRGGSSKRSPFTPTRSDGSKSYLSGYADYHPNYMAYTESSRAKVRSLSAPKQRPQYDRSSSSTKRLYGEPIRSSAQSASLHASFTSKAYPGSGRLDRLGLPVAQGY